MIDLLHETENSAAQAWEKNAFKQQVNFSEQEFFIENLGTENVKVALHVCSMHGERSNGLLYFLLTFLCVFAIFGILI